MSGGGRFDFLAAVLPDPVGCPGAAPDDADEDHDPMRRRAVAGFNEALLAKAAAGKLLRTDKVRADTTVVEADVGLSDRLGAVGQGGRHDRPHRGADQSRRRRHPHSSAGSAPLGGSARPVDRRPSCGCAASSNAIRPRPRCGGSPGSWPTSPRRPCVRPPRCCATPNARCARPPGSAKAGCAERSTDLDTMVGRTQRVVAQARSRLAGVMPESATRLVSLHDADARPIRKGRLGKPVEFGYKAQIVDNADGVILDHTVEIGNPADAPQLAPAIERITRRTGRPPRAVTADRGYGQASVERDLHDLGVRSVAIPRAAKPGAARREFEHRRAFRDKVKWRTGSEGRINHLKRSYGWNRTELTGITGARTWCGHGVFAHNLVKISALAA